jgi:thioredoxin-like negative regulator of GroEL
MSPVLLRVLVLGGVGLIVFGTIAVLRRYFSSAKIPSRFDLSDIHSNGTRPPAALVEFVSPYCFECREALPLLKAAARVYEAPLAVIDAKQQPELASKYSIRHTPTILVVDSRGAVRGGWLGVPPEHELEAALATAGRVASA